MRRPVFVALIALLAATACVSVSKSVLTSSFQANPVATEDVYVFFETDKGYEDCSRVAILHGSGTSDWTNQGQIIDKLREETGKLGGNALLLQSMEEAGTGEKIVSGLFGTRSDTDSDALALRCPDSVIAAARKLGPTQDGDSESQ
jgi:hypothetical protein